MWDYNGAGTYSWAGTGTGAGSNKYYTFYQYDPNGNLTNLLRYDGTPTLIDNLGYVYYAGTNRLSQVGDGHSGPEGVLNGQAPNNYVYDKTGNLIEDVQSDATIYWNSYGKVPRVVIGDGLFYGRVNDYHYGPDQNRWLKTYADVDLLVEENTYYIRDAQGNVLSTYLIQKDFNTTAFEFTWQAQYLYGSARIGSLSPNRTYNGVFNSGINLPDSAIFAGDSLQLCLGWKRYEISNHLDNVTATVSDRKRPVDTNADEIADYYNPTILSATDYYPFGMDMPNRSFNAGDYRFGFNGKEADRNGEWGNLNHYDYGFRIYNPGIAKFLSVDPLRREYPWYTPYQFAGNTPIQAIDIDGLEPGKVNGGGTLDCPDCAASLDVDEDWITVTAKRLPESFTRVVDPGLSSDPISRAIIRRIQAGDHDFSIRGAISSNSVDGYSSSNYTDGVKNVFGGLLWAGGGAPLLATTFGASARLGGTFLKGAGINLAAQVTIHSTITGVNGELSFGEVARRIDLADIALAGFTGGGSTLQQIGTQVILPSLVDFTPAGNGFQATGFGKSGFQTGIDLISNSLFFGIGSLSSVKSLNPATNSRMDAIDAFIRWNNSVHYPTRSLTNRLFGELQLGSFLDSGYKHSLTPVLGGLRNVSLNFGQYFDFGEQATSNSIKELEKK